MMSRDKNQTLERILNAALHLLESGQGKGVRMSDIAKAAGISRQAVYMHFPTRAALLIATTRHIDVIKNVDGRLEKSRKAKTGLERLNAFIEAWGGYIPEIYGVACALRKMRDEDYDARMAWEDRMNAVRQGCEAVVMALQKDSMLCEEYDEKQATDILCSLLSVETWEQLTKACGWTQEAYIENMKLMAWRSLGREHP